MLEFDLAILGGGPAGYTAAAKAAEAGLRVVIFEKEALGGTCLNVGCIPTKTLLYSAKQYYQASHADKYGVTASDVQFDYAKMVQRKQKVVRKLAAGIRQQLQACTIVTGEAKVMVYSEEKVQIACGEELYEAAYLLLATGSHNFVPPIPGLQDNEAVWDSTDALNTKELPASVAIIGGGVIGMEFATLYHELGVPVVVIEAMPNVLPAIDGDIVSLLCLKFRKEGVNIMTNTRVTKVEGGRVYFADTLHAAEPTEEFVEAERILVCVGRRANIEGLEVLPLEIERGSIVVNDRMLTNLPNVFAAGDVTGKIMLAHVASHQAVVAVENILHAMGKSEAASQMHYDAVPSVVYTNPEIASVGAACPMETSATDTSTPVEGTTNGLHVKQFPMTYSGRFVAENEGENGLCKLVLNAEDRVVGAHLYGNPCSEFIAVAAMGIQAGLTAQQWHQTIFPHPTVCEVLG